LNPPTPAELLDASCVECGVSFPPEELVSLAGKPVCASCKPVFLERLRERAPLSGRAIHCGFHRWRDELVVEEGGVAPPRCIQCNAPATWRRPRTFHWHPGWVWIFLLGYFLTYIIVALLTRTDLQFDLCLCEVHARRRRRRLALAWSLCAAVLLLPLLGTLVFLRSSPYLAFIWLGALAAAIAAAMIAAPAANLLSPIRIRGGLGRFRGAGKAYLDSLQPWTGGPP
jgi:hypothetical protein